MAYQNTAPEQLTLRELEAICRRETRLYFQDQSSDSRFCLEIFRRALLLQSVRSDAIEQHPGSPAYADKEARAALVRMYTEFIHANIQRKTSQYYQLDDLTQQV